MAWLRGSFPDLAGAVNKISESVKNIEKNFDNALGLEEQNGGSSSTVVVDASHAWSPEFMAFVGQNNVNDSSETSKKFQSSKESASAEKHDGSSSRPKGEYDADEANKSTEEKNFEVHVEVDGIAEKPADTSTVIRAPDEVEHIGEKPVENNISTSDETTVIADLQTKPSANDDAEVSQHVENSKIGSTKSFVSIDDDELRNFVDQVVTTSSELASYDGRDGTESESYGLHSHATEVRESIKEGQPLSLPSSGDASETVPDDEQRDEKEHNTSLGGNLSDNADSAVELETLRTELKNMETALLGAARQAQAKADEIEKLMTENEHLKSITADQKRKSNADIESLQEEYHQRVSALERKLYALTRERDTLRREQNKRSDATALLKEKDDIITQVMAEGEELSKKQAVQESTIRKLRAQIREFEEEKKRFISKLQIEENNMESLKKDKAAIEKLLQETIDKNKGELAAQKEHFLNALSATKEEISLAEAQANIEARTALENRLRETEEREAMLVQTLEELRKTLSRKEQQAVYREDMLRKDMDDLQKQCQASERRCEELVMPVPESTRPLLRQIEAMQEATASKAEAWDAMERSLNIQLQDAEAKAAAAEEKYCSVNKHLSQTLSRVNVLEAQISCLRAEQTQLTRSLEKERQRASESRQDYLALKEEADTNKGHVNQVKEEMKELKRKHKLEIQEALTQHKLLQQEIEREKAARVELEKTTRRQVSTGPGKSSIAKTRSVSAHGLTRRLSSARSLSSMEESLFPQAYKDSSRNFSEGRDISPFYLKSMTPSAFQAALRQKEGELASYMCRLV